MFISKATSVKSESRINNKEVNIVSGCKNVILSLVHICTDSKTNYCFT